MPFFFYDGLSCSFITASIPLEENSSYTSISHNTNKLSDNNYSESQSTTGNQHPRNLNLCFAIIAASCFVSAALTYKKDSN